MGSGAAAARRAEEKPCPATLPCSWKRLPVAALTPRIPASSVELLKCERDHPPIPPSQCRIVHVVDSMPTPRGLDAICENATSHPVTNRSLCCCMNIHAVCLQYTNVEAHVFSVHLLSG